MLSLAALFWLVTFSVSGNVTANSTILLTDNVTITESASSTGPKTYDLTWHAFAIPAGVVAIIILRKYRSLNAITLKYYEKGVYGAKKIASPYKDAKIEELVTFAGIVSNNLRNLIAIYGILLAFIVTTKLSLAFQSWVFALWAGWILAVIVQAGKIGHNLADLTLRQKNVEEVGRQIHIANLFYKHAIYIFVPLIALTPIFFFVTEPKIEDLPFDQRIAIVSVTLAIIAVCFLVYWLFTFTTETSVSQLYSLIFTILILVLFNAIGESPLKPYSMTAFGSAVVQVPSATYWVIFFAGLGSYAIVGNLAVGVAVGYTADKIKFRRK